MTWKRRLGIGLAGIGLTAVVAAGCGDDGEGTDVTPPSTECDAGDSSWVRQALLALNGQRPQSQAEVLAYADVLAGMRAQGLSDGDARRMVARAMMAEKDTYRERWSDFLMDALGVIRSPFITTGEWDTVQAKSCFGPRLVDATDDGYLAAWVRDNSPLAQDPPVPEFKMSRLLSSTLYLDDLTPLLRAQLFQMLTFPLGGANVAEDDLELARRNSFGATFEDVFLNRDTSCLGCHNSEVSVTQTYPIEGMFERALFGTPQAALDPDVYRAMFRVRDVLVLPESAFGDLDPGEGPWGWSPQDCRGFAAPTTPDPLGINASFGTVQGTEASIWRLEIALRNGFEGLRGVGLQVGADGSVAPDDALAYLVSTSVVERVWEEVMGWPLTVSHRFPRTEIQRETMKSLTDHFVQQNYSLKSLLAEIVAHPAFNRALPGDGEGCDEPMPPLFNPWSIDEEDEELRGNTLGDRVFPLSTRLLRRSLHASMGWVPAKDYPTTVEEETWDNAVGLFTSPSKRGFRGLGFQALLTWESRYGSCDPGGNEDFISALVAHAATRPEATIGDAVIALKDRLASEPLVDSGEIPSLEAILGRSLATPVAEVPAADLESGLRQVCGAVVVQPQFLLGGIAPKDGDIPALTLPEHDYPASCDRVRTNFERFGGGATIECEESSLVVRLP